MNHSFWLRKFEKCRIDHEFMHRSPLAVGVFMPIELRLKRRTTQLIILRLFYSQFFFSLFSHRMRWSEQEKKQMFIKNKNKCENCASLFYFMFHAAWNWDHLNNNNFLDKLRIFYFFYDKHFAATTKKKIKI